MQPTKMMRIAGVGVNSQRKRLLDILTKLGCVQIVKAQENEHTCGVDEDLSIDMANIKLARLAFAQAFIKEQRGITKRLAKSGEKYYDYSLHDEGVERIRVKVAPKDIVTDMHYSRQGESNTDDACKKQTYKPEKAPLIPRKPEISYDDFMTSDQREKPIFDLVKQLEEYNQELLTIKAEEAKSRTLIEQISPFANLTLKLNKYKDTEYCCIKIGVLKSKKAAAVTEQLEELQGTIYEIFGNIQDKKALQCAIVIVALKENSEAIQTILDANEFTPYSTTVGQKARDLLEKETVNLKICKARREEIAASVVYDYANLQFVADTRLLEDFYNVKRQMLLSETDMRKTDTVFVFEGWVPDNCIEAIQQELDESDMALAYITRDADESETPPTLLEDNGFVTPYQSVTNMYSVPTHNEINPNPFVAFFFILFFGVMLSDAGYGIIITIAMSTILAIAKPRKGEMNLIKILLAGGISTVFWGVMFGGYFGIEDFFIKPILFNPIDEPMSMLFLSLGLGMLQMLVGIGINAYALFKQKKPLDAIFGTLSWYVLLIGAGLIFIKQVPKIAAIVVTVVGVVGLMIGGALHKKGIKKVSGGFANLYSLIGFFSDLMSYTRLFGLGLASSVIAMVFNQLSGIIVGINPVIGYIAMPFILLVGHAFNIFINTLGAYVHNSRLQFVEFFNKFYTGGGYLFQPLGSNRKYYNFTREEVTKS